MFCALGSSPVVFVLIKTYGMDVCRELPVGTLFLTSLSKHEELDETALI